MNFLVTCSFSRSASSRTSRLLTEMVDGPEWLPRRGTLGRAIEQEERAAPPHESTLSPCRRSIRSRAAAVLGCRCDPLPDRFSGAVSVVDALRGRNGRPVFKRTAVRGDLLDGRTVRERLRDRRTLGAAPIGRQDVRPVEAREADTWTKLRQEVLGALACSVTS
jgi:hypothetical protein